LWRVAATVSDRTCRANRGVGRPGGVPATAVVAGEARVHDPDSDEAIVGIFPFVTRVEIEVFRSEIPVGQDAGALVGSIAHLGVEKDPNRPGRDREALLHRFIVSVVVLPVAREAIEDFVSLLLVALHRHRLGLPIGYADPDVDGWRRRKTDHPHGGEIGHV